MGWVALKGISLQGRVGAFKEEHQTGVNLILDISVELPLNKASQTDHLSDAFDYAVISRSVAKTFKHKYHLLETAARQVAMHILEEKPEVQRIRIRIQKLNPVLQLMVHSSEVEWDYPEDW